MKVSICTPTFNRAYCLNKLYFSLVNQTSKEFEWIVIDDGSTDNTQTLIEEWEKENKINIKYLYKVNGGKHTAINEAVNIANGCYFFIVDSDDFLKNYAVEMIINTFLDLPNNFAGVGFLKEFVDGECVGTSFKGDYLDATSLRRSFYNITGDKAEVFYTEVLRKYPFPVFNDEKFLTEAIVWNRIANDGYAIRWINKSIYVCQYQQDGLSININYLNNFKGYSLFVKELISYKEASLMDKIKYLGVYAYYARLSNVKDKIFAKNVNCSVIVFKFCRLLFRVKCTFKKTSRKSDLKIK